jgi:glycolate oxidase
MAMIAMPAPDRRLVARRAEIVEGLTKVLGADRVLHDDDSRRAYETDALTAYACKPLCVALPRTTAEVAQSLAWCRREGVKVIPRAAGTSLVGGALPTADSVVVCIAKMNRVLEVDYANRFARVEAGITNLAVTQAVAAEGFFYAPDPSSQLASTIAGNIAMNSGGAHCLKYGVTTNNVLGVTLVTMEGEVVEFGGPHLDAPGYDLLGLINGSEGQLGIVTEATVRILKAAEGSRPMMLGFASLDAAGKAVSAIIASGLIPVAIEFMDKPAIQICEDFARAGYPRDVEALLIIEVEGSEAEIAASLKQIQKLAEPFKPTTTVISTSPEQSAKIWKGRKSAFGAVGRLADYYCMDGTIPLGRLPDMLAAITDICARHKLRVANIFHAGDGNLHPLILYNANDPDEALRAEQAGAEILTKCVEVGGCLTGEHGVGIEKRDLMRVQFNDTDLAVQMRLKTAFDPAWLLNPAKVFPLDAQVPVADAAA